MINNNESNKWIVSNDSSSKPQQLISHVVNNNQPNLMLSEQTLSTLKDMIVKFTSNYKGCTVSFIGKQKTNKSTTTNHAFSTNFQVGTNSLIQTTQGVFYEHRVITNGTNNEKLNLVLFDFEGFDASNVEDSEIRNALSMRYMQFAHAFSNLIVFSLGQYASVIDEFITTLEMKGESFSSQITKPHLLILQHCAEILSNNVLEQVKKQTLTQKRMSKLEFYFSDITYIVCFKDPNQNKVSLSSLNELRNEICNTCCSNYHDNIKVIFDLQEVLNWKDIIENINNNKSIEAAVDTCGRVSEQKCQKGYQYAIKEWDKTIRTQTTSKGCNVLMQKDKIIKEVKDIYMESGAFGAHYDKYLKELETYITKDYKYFIKCSGRCGHCNNKSCTMYESHSEDGKPKCDCNECCLDDKVPQDNSLYKNNHCKLQRGHQGHCHSKDCNHSCSGSECSSLCNSKEPNHGSGNVPHSCMKNVSINCSVCKEQFNTYCGYPKICGKLKIVYCKNGCGDCKQLKCGETYYCGKTMNKSCSRGCGKTGTIKCGEYFYCSYSFTKSCSTCGYSTSVRCGDSFTCNCCYGKCIKCGKNCTQKVGHSGSHKCGNCCVGKCSCGKECTRGSNHSGSCGCSNYGLKYCVNNSSSRCPKQGYSCGTYDCGCSNSWLYKDSSIFKLYCPCGCTGEPEAWRCCGNGAVCAFNPSTQCGGEIRIDKQEVNKILTEEWNILNKDYPIIKLGKGHRTRLKEMENIKKIKNTILETLSPIATFIFLHKIDSLDDVLGPFLNSKKALLLLYRMIKGVNFDGFYEQIPPSTFKEYYNFIYGTHYDDLNKRVDDCLKNMFSNKNLRIVCTKLQNLELFIHCTMILDRHDTHIEYDGSNNKNIVLIDINGYILQVSQSEKAKDNVDFNIFKRMHIERILELQDCLVLNDSYKQGLFDYIIHLQEKGFDLNENNFNMPICKIYRINMINNELLYNQQFNGFKFIIETSFARHNKLFSYFGSKYRKRITKIEKFNLEFKIEWLNDKFEFLIEILLENADKRVEEKKAKRKEMLKLQDEYLKELLGDNLLEDSLGGDDWTNGIGDEMIGDKEMINDEDNENNENDNTYKRKVDQFIGSMLLKDNNNKIPINDEEKL
ncbi:hypothetical protein ABK040_003951 [Willaertia magna]